jgi:hypothetical protein
MGMSRDSDTRRRRNEALSKAGKQHAAARKCPDCQRKGAVSREVRGEIITRWCRYCRWLEVRDYSR